MKLKFIYDSEYIKLQRINSSVQCYTVSIFITLHLVEDERLGCGNNGKPATMLFLFFLLSLFLCVSVCVPVFTIVKIAHRHSMLLPSATSMEKKNKKKKRKRNNKIKTHSQFATRRNFISLVVATNTTTIIIITTAAKIFYSKIEQGVRVQKRQKRGITINIK